MVREDNERQQEFFGLISVFWKSVIITGAMREQDTVTSILTAVYGERKKIVLIKIFGFFKRR